MSSISRQALRRQHEIADAEAIAAEDEYRAVLNLLMKTPIGSPDLKATVRKLSVAVGQVVDKGDKAEKVFRSYSNSV